MNTIERIKMLKAMEFIARKVNDEEVFESWLILGIADEDIVDGDLSVKQEDPEDLEIYTIDEHFADIMDTFLNLMNAARDSGGLFCDGIVSKEEE